MNNDIIPPPAKPAIIKQILCLEDEPFIGDLYRRAVEKAGHKIDVITDGQTGLDRAKTNKYDVILLDIMVPQMLGIDVLHHLRQECPDLKAKIVITTNLEQDEQTRAKIEAEADAYLIKADITPRQLVEFIADL